MRVLLDENLPRRLARELTGHDARTVPQMGWASLKNGALLTAAGEAAFQVLLTMDQNMPAQQTIERRPFGVVIVRARDNQLATLLPFVPDILQAISVVAPGQVVRVGP
jgi:predicted nuclease of predicted toxin-antitoxin system